MHGGSQARIMPAVSARRDTGSQECVLQTFRHQRQKQQALVSNDPACLGRPAALACKDLSFSHKLYALAPCFRCVQSREVCGPVAAMFAALLPPKHRQIPPCYPPPSA